MSSGITTTIKLKPYLREFILNAFLNNKPVATCDDPLGKIIKPWLIKQPDIFVKVPDSISYFTFELPYYNDKNILYNNFISSEGQYYIEDVFEIICKHNMFPYLDKVMPKYDNSIKSCILDWCYSFNVTFEYIQYEMLKKAYYRYRNNKKISSKSVPGMSPGCPWNVSEFSESHKKLSYE